MTSFMKNVIIRKLSGNFGSIDQLEAWYFEKFFSRLKGLMFKKNIIGEPFDKAYFAYHEDTYLAWLARLRGYRLKVVPKSFVYHEGEIIVKKAKKLKPFFAELAERNRIMNLFLFYQARNLVLLFPMFLVSLVLLNAGLSNLIPRLRAYSWLIANFGSLLRKRSVIQSQRKVTDAEITQFMSHKLFEEENRGLLRGLFTVLNRLSLAYCRLVGIKTI